MLEKLYEERIFEVEVEDDRKLVTFTVRCDGWYGVALNKREMRLLIGELEAIHDKMEKTG